MTTVQDIQEGTAYHAGEVTRLYDPADRASAEAVLFKKCMTWAIGPLKIDACADTLPPGLSVTVTLLGTTIGRCELSLANQDCRIGGSVDGFKALVTLSFQPSPLAIVIKGEFCAPFVGCTNFGPVTIPLG